jgi:hypothetical protein
MKSTRSLFFTLLAFFFASPLAARSEPLGVFRVAPGETLAAILEKPRDRDAAVFAIGALRERGVAALVGASAPFLDGESPVYGGWFVSEENPTAMGLVLVFETADPEGFTKALPGGWHCLVRENRCFVSKLPDLCGRAADFPDGFRDHFSRNEERGITIKIFVARVWKRYRPMSQIMRTMICLGVSADPGLQKMAGQSMEVLFLLADSVSEAVLHVDPSFESGCRDFSIRFRFKENAFVKGLFPRVLMSPPGIAPEKRYSSIRVVFSPKKIRDAAKRFIDLFVKTFLASPAEAQSMRNRLDALFGKDPDPGLILVDCLSFDDAGGFLNNVIRIERREGALTLEGLKDTLEQMFLRGPYSCETEMRTRGDERVLDVSFAPASGAEPGPAIPPFLARVLRILAGMEPRVRLEFAEREGRLFGFLGEASFRREFDPEALRLSPARTAPFFEILLKPALFAKIWNIFVLDLDPGQAEAPPFGLFSKEIGISLFRTEKGFEAAIRLPVRFPGAVSVHAKQSVPSAAPSEPVH